MANILPILLILLGLGAGVGAGLALRPDPQAAALDNPCGDVAAEGHAEPATPEPAAAPANVAYVKLNNQFVVPIVHDDRIDGLVVMSLSLQVPEGSQDIVFAHEPKLRDAFLQVLFDHANGGGFDGAFTSGGNLTLLRRALSEAARKVLGETVSDVLIVDLVRQDT